MKLIDIEAINWYDDLFLKGVNHSGGWVRYRDVEKLIRNAPIVDAEPVVRCKDCLLQRGCKPAQYLGDDGYCSHGERKGGDK